MGRITYYLDGNELVSTYGVHVSGSKGIIGRPALKEFPSVEYADMHGEIVDTSKPRYRAREITLQCFVESESRNTTISLINTFLSAIDGAGLHRLEVALDGNKYLFFEVYRSNSSYATPEWDGTTVATFSIVMSEPEPLKKVYKRETQTGLIETFSIVAPEAVNIYWGDGTVSNSQEAGEVQKTWASEGTQYIVVAGNISGFALYAINEETGDKVAVDVVHAEI